MNNKGSRAEEEQIDCRLFGLDVATDLVDRVNETDICLDECEFALGIQFLAFRSDTIPGLLGTADEIDAWLAGMLGESLQTRFADPTGCADENGDKAGGEGSGNSRIRGLNLGKRYHLGLNGRMENRVAVIVPCLLCRKSGGAIFNAGGIFDWGF